MEFYGIPADSLIHSIDDFMNEFGVQDDTVVTGIRKSEFNIDAVELNIAWNEFKTAIEDFRNHPTETSRNRLFVVSEQCWKKANEAVMTAQLETESKLQYIRQVLAVIVSNIVMLSFVILPRQSTIESERVIPFSGLAARNSPLSLWRRRFPMPIR